MGFLYLLRRPDRYLDARAAEVDLVAGLDLHAPRIAAAHVDRAAVAEDTRARSSRLGPQSQLAGGFVVEDAGVLAGDGLVDVPVFLEGHVVAAPHPALVVHDLFHSPD